MRRITGRDSRDWCCKLVFISPVEYFKRFTQSTVRLCLCSSFSCIDMESMRDTHCPLPFKQVSSLPILMQQHSGGDSVASLSVSVLLLMLIAFIQCYSPLSNRLTTLLSHVILNECHQVVYLQCCLVLLVPCKTATVSVHSVYTIQPCTMSHHFMQSYIRRVHVCLAVT